MEGPAVQSARSANEPLLAPEQAIITPSDVRKILIKRKWLILAGIVVGLAFAAVYILTTIPQFEAISLLDINSGKQSNIGITDLVQEQQGGIEASIERTATEIAIMQSDTVSLDVINTLDLYHKEPFAQVFVRHARTFWPSSRGPPRSPPSRERIWSRCGSVIKARPSRLRSRT